MCIESVSMLRDLQTPGQRRPSAGKPHRPATVGIGSVSEGVRRSGQWHSDRQRTSMRASG
jgi:hypothetical protein